jgi:vacuolar-type H+-ATPase subunit C/Vma6
VQGAVANLSVDYAFPRLHGVWARSFAGAALERLVSAGSEPALGRLLAPLGVDVGQRTTVQRQVLRRHIADLGAARRLMAAGIARFYTAFMDRHFFEDLKAILYCRLFPERDVAIHDLLIAAPELPPLAADALCAAQDVRRLLELLPDHPCREALEPVIVALDETRNVLAAECRLDQIFFAALRAAADSLPRAGRPSGRELVGSEIDIVNILMLRRNQDTYGLPPEAMRQLCLAGGMRLPTALCSQLCQCPDAAALLEALPAFYRSLLLPFAGAELSLSENALWNALWRRARAHFSHFDVPTASLIAFPYLKRFEALNCGRVFEATRFGLGAGDIREMMIGPGHV